MADKEIIVSLTDPLKDHLIEQGFDEQFGARPLRYELQHLVEDPLAEKLLKKEIKQGERLLVDYQNGRIKFLKK